MWFEVVVAVLACCVSASRAAALQTASQPAVFSAGGEAEQHRTGTAHHRPTGRRGTGFQPHLRGFSTSGPVR